MQLCSIATCRITALLYGICTNVALLYAIYTNAALLQMYRVCYAPSPLLFVNCTHVDALSAKLDKYI
jgi:hypothetical protein